ncbi:MAG: hypothetical protein JJU28_24370 [Cyclobacteriaceae bacterium]|nr:hypothetical protein [Cyclobacteriaceae bacterium]
MQDQFSTGLMVRRRLFMPVICMLGIQLFLITPLTGARYFHRITRSDGLASNNVYCIWQDKKGFIWVGTSNGLQRYDGKYFQYFNIQQPQSLPAQPVRQIMEDRDGNMWIRHGDRYGTYSPATLSFTIHPFENKENRYHGESLFIDSKGDVYIILKRNKLLMLNKTTGFFSDKDVNIQVPEGYEPICLFEDKKTGYYWIGCQQGLAVYDPSNAQLYFKSYNPLALPHIDDPEIRIVFSYSIDTDRNHWCVYWNPDQRFSTYQEKTSKYIKMPDGLVNKGLDYHEIKSHFLSKSGQFWFYGVNSLYHFKPSDQSFEFLSNIELQYAEVYQMYDDREGNLWLATDEGLYFYSDNFPEVRYAFFKESDPANLFVDIQEIWLPDKKEYQYWLASWGRGLILLNNNLIEQNAKLIYKNAPEVKAMQQPWCILQERSTQKVWVGTQAGYLLVIDPETHQTQFYRFPIFNNSTIRSMSQDKMGNIWFTNQRGDLIKYNAGHALENQSFELVHSFNSFAYAHRVDDEMRVWVCTSNYGVYILDGNTGEIIIHLDDRVLSSNKQEKIAQLNDSIFFFAYDLLNAYNVKTGENRILSYSDGLISNDILSMLVDNDGFLWIYTPNGICRYNYHQNSFTHYDQKDGFGPLEKDGYSGTITHDGRVIFAAYSSIAVFNPLHFNTSVKPDRPILTHIKLFNHYLFSDSLNTENKRTFSHLQNAFTFQFSTLNYANQDKLKYFHRLNGIENEWQSSGSANMAVYSLLPPGRYVLEFRSENEEGLSSPIGNFVFRIMPPFYDTWWFKLTLAIVLLLTLYFFYRLRIQRIMAVVKIRNRVARDLHDDMGSTLSTINILSVMAKTKLGTDPVKASEYMSKITDNSQNMMEAMDDIVWSIKPQNDTMDKVLARMREYATETLEARSIDLQFETDPAVQQIKLSMDKRRDLFLIFKEAINNLAKYSLSPSAYVEFKLMQSKSFLLIIKDEGKGFDVLHADTGNGLSNMKKRALQMGAQFEIDSKFGSGTTISLRMKV